MPKLKFFGEGNDDVGKHESENEPNCLQALVSNILENLSAEQPQFEWKSNQIDQFIKKYKVHGIHSGSVRSKRVERAMAHAMENNFDGAIFIIDRDGEKQRLKEIETGRETFHKKGILFPMAIGVVIEELEAWLLADHKVRRNIFGPKGGDDLGDIEKISNPKIKFEDLFEQHFRGKDQIDIPTKGEIKRKLARESNIKAIAKECPKGFKPFMDEVKKHIAPLFDN